MIHIYFLVLVENFELHLYRIFLSNRKSLNLLLFFKKLCTKHVTKLRKCVNITKFCTIILQAIVYLILT